MADQDSDPPRPFGADKLGQFIDAIPGDVRAEVERLPKQIALMNAKASAKIHRIHAVVDHVFASADAYVACRRGCAYCCYIAVPITRAEAAYIGERIGLAPADIRTSRRRDEKSFSEATPCTFLQGNDCSIYEYRPRACRSHFNFDADNTWCRFENWDKPEADIPKPHFEPIREAYLLASSRKGEELVIADIRDFFPEPKKEF